MAGNTRAGIRTKDAMADALIELLDECPDIDKVRIRQVTERCDIDRQAFYYHFKNIHELATYAYHRAIIQGFDGLDKEEINNLGWRERLDRILDLFSGDSVLGKAMISVMGTDHARDAMNKALRKELDLSYLPYLLKRGIEPERAESTCYLLSYMLQSVFIAWLMGTIDLTKDELVGKLTEVVRDYAVGASSNSKNG